MTNVQPAGEPDRCADIAAALYTLAMRFTDLAGTGVPVPYVQLNIQPGRHGDDESIVAAVDAVTSALLGHAGQAQHMHDVTWHYNNADEPEYVGPVGVRIFNSVTPECAAKREAAARLAEREAELERLRAEVAELRAAAKVGTAAEHLPDPAPSWAAEGMRALAEEVRAAQAEVCTPACDALQADSAKATGLDRSWHSDDCPVPVMHLVLDGEHATVCGIAHADRPEAHGRTPDHEAVTCKACIDRMPF